MNVEIRKTKDGKIRYLARIKVGEAHVGSKTFNRKSDAERWEREQRHRLDTGRQVAVRSSFTLAQLIESFQKSRERGNPHTIDTDNNNLAALPRSLVRRPLSTIHAEDIREHLLNELRSGKAPSTVARSRTTLSALFTYADDQYLLEQPHPVRAMRKIPQLSTMAQRSVSLGEIPTPTQVARALNEIRNRRSDIADVFEFMALTGIRWGEARAARVSWLSVTTLAQLNVNRSHSDSYAEKDPKSWRGTRSIPLSPRGLEIFRAHASGKKPNDYLFTNAFGGQLSVRVARKFALGFRRHALRHYAASTWLRLGTPVHEVAEYLGDDPRTVLAVYAHVLGEGQRLDFAQRLAAAEWAHRSPRHPVTALDRSAPNRTQPRSDPGLGI